MFQGEGEGSNGTSFSNGLRYIPAGLSRNRSELPLIDNTYNGTGHYVLNDEADPNLTDTQTLFLACFATLVPLILSLLTAFAVRKIWRKYRRNRECRSYDGVLQQEESSDRLSGQSGAPLHAHLLNSEKVKTSESQFSITPDEIECSSSPVLYSGSSSRTNHASANGSIITMTLKNNHLIVETEERNDIIEDCRETTMKYSPALQDGVFVVEVQQSVRPRNPGANSGYACTQEDALQDQRALVHNPPERFADDETLDEVDEEYYPETISPTPNRLKSSSTNTGLSQSTISISSDDLNSNYTYGNQQGYDLGQYGYPVYNGYINDGTIPRLPDTKPKITAAVYKQNGRLSTMHSIDCGLLSDQLVKELESESNDPIQEEQIRLGNTAVENDSSAIIQQIKHSIITANPPKFEKLQNDLSPLTVNNSGVSEYENKAFETEIRKK